MTDAKIFLVNKTNRDLTPLTETRYATEADLQAFLARYPDLLPGEQISPEAPRRWLLVAREVSIPDREEGTGRFSLDHLFLDQQGIPTLVECKRASDTRARREVVAQMLDYAANGTHYWPMDRLRQLAAETAEAEQTSLDDKIRILLGLDDEVDERAIEDFWETVEQNLRAGQVRLIFVGDEIPRELRRLVEFLNEKMTEVEVLAVEIKQFLSQADSVVLVPRVIGLTEASRTNKPSARSGRKTSRAEFLAHFEPPVSNFFEAVLDRAAERGHVIYWGEKGFSVRAVLPKSGKLATFAFGWPDQTFDLHLHYLPWPEAERETLRQPLLATGIFRDTGKTLRAKLSVGQDLAPFYQAYELILNQIDHLLQSS